MIPGNPMVRWYQVRRMRAPVYLILTGVLFLLDQWHVLGFSKSWPLYLIVAGAMAFAERAAWAADAAQQQTFPAQPSTGKAHFVPDGPGAVDNKSGPEQGGQS
jgi:hypothetical protein